MHAKDLTPGMRLRLTGDALLMFYSCAERFHAEACRGAAMAVSGEPVADLNYLMLNCGDSGALTAFRRYVGWCDERDLPSACMVAPGASEASRQAGAAAFFLGATPAGFRLYQRLGYETLYRVKVWVRGETHQA